MTTKILIVEDDGDLRSLLSRVLTNAGYEVIEAGDGAEGVRLFFESRPHLVLLDIRLPKLDGWQVLKRIREVSETPVIILTTLNEEKHTVYGLESGADDYLPKPFSIEELLARSSAILRRYPPSKTNDETVPYADSVLRLDFARREVYVRDVQVTLSPTEFKLLAVLVRNADKLLAPEALIAEGWSGATSSSENLRVYIGYLRKKLGDESAEYPLIENLRGFGYRYNVPKQS